MSQSHSSQKNAKTCGILYDKTNHSASKLQRKHGHQAIENIRDLESAGCLTPSLLEAFSLNHDLRRISLTNSFKRGNITVKDCAKYLYKGFKNLSVLDLTDMPITDNELRYMIKLSSLHALGLSNTLITNKGLKYVAQHGSFKESLRCLKLCNLTELNDCSISFIKCFPNLIELDLRGCKNISINGCRNLVTDRHLTLSRKHIRLALPEHIHHDLVKAEEDFRFHVQVNSGCHHVITDPNDVRLDSMPISEMQAWVQLFQKIQRASNISESSVKATLVQHLRLKRKDDLLLSLYQG